MSLFERLSNNSLKSQARETGVPAPILKKVYNRGVKDGEKTTPESDTDAWGKARVASFVRGGSDREKDSDLWDKYQQEPQAEEAKVTLPGNEKPVPKAGIMLAVPEIIARYFPKKEDEDTSPPHATLLFVGAITSEQEKDLVRVVREVADRWPPFRVDLTKYSEFVNKDGMTIANMIPAAAISLSSRDDVHRGLGSLHADLFAAVEDIGIDVQHNYGGEKQGSFSDREEAFKPHVTLAYMPPGEKYTGPMPTGSWHANEIEIWGHDKYRIPLGLKIQPSYSVPTTSVPVEDEDPTEPTIELRVEPVQVTQTVAEEVSPETSTPQVAPVVSIFRPFANSSSQRAAAEDLPQELPEVQVKEEVTPEPAKAAGSESAEVDLAEPATTVETRATWLPVRLFESFGHFEGSILDFGGTENHDYARHDLVTEDQDHTILNRRWKTIVCGTLAEQTKPQRTSTLLALRGLLRRDGKALVAIPVGQQVEDWEPLFERFFSIKRLPVRGAVAWQLTPTSEFTEQDAPVVPVNLPGSSPPIQLPPINIGPVILKIPERQVQVQVQAPITFNVPEQAPPQVNIAAGAVKVDVHAPLPAAPVKKRVTMKKDVNGLVTGELEVVEDESPKRPEFPDMAELLSTPERGD